jgi:hypothetical protein
VTPEAYQLPDVGKGMCHVIACAMCSSLPWLHRTTVLYKGSFMPQCKIIFRLIMIVIFA